MMGLVPVRDCVLARMPFMTLIATVQAPPVCLGLADRALEEFIALAKGKERMYAAKPSDQAAVHAAVAKAEAGVRASRSYYYEAVTELWNAADSGNPIDADMRANVRMACLNAAEASVSAIDTYYRHGGSTSIFQPGALERCWRDAHTAAQHVQVQEARWVTAGRVLFGLEPDGPMF